MFITVKDQGFSPKKSSHLKYCSTLSICFLNNLQKKLNSFVINFKLVDVL